MLDENSKQFNKLVEVCSIQSYSQNEYRMVVYLIKQLELLHLYYEIDSIGNILVTKGTAKTYPCVVSHIDTVHSIINNYRVWYEITTKTGIKLYAKQEDNDNNTPAGIGGDDKCGIFACLHFLTTLPIIKVVFFTREETGCVGSSGINKHFFDDCRYIIQLDRRHKSDFIDKHYRGFTANNKFRSEIGHIKKKYRFKSTTGIITDSIKLWQDGVGISCINLSCGYYEPHTCNEYILLDELWNSVCLADEMIKTLKPQRYECHPEPIKKIDYSSNWHNNRTEYEQCQVCKSWKDNRHGFVSSKHNNKFVCYSCFHEPTLEQFKEIDKEEIPCNSCGTLFVNALATGIYKSLNPDVFICFDCLKSNKTIKLNNNITDKCVVICDMCNKTMSKTRGRYAPEHDCEFLCYDCLRTYFGVTGNIGDCV